MFDITFVFEAAMTLLLGIALKIVWPWIQSKIENEKTKQILEIVARVVYATWELEITGELVEMGQTTAEHAWVEAKKLLAKNNLTVNDEELKIYVKNAVAALRLARKDEIKDEITEPEQAA